MNYIINWRKPIIFTLLYLSGSKIPKYLKEIKWVDKFSLEEKKKYQDKKIEKLLLHAYNNVPYYRNVLGEAGIVVDGDVELEYFDRIPVLTKDIIREEGQNLYSRDYKKRKPYENTSGGSTGEPVRFLQDKEYSEWNNATKLYIFNDWFKKEIGQAEINLWGSEIDIYKNTLSMKEKVINYLYNRVFLNAFMVSDNAFRRFVDVINKVKPFSMWVYVESVDCLAEYIKNNQLYIHSPNFIISTAGTLYPEIRRNVENVFTCPVYNQYGSREVGAIGIECEIKTGLHEFFWNNYIEIIDSQIFITTLNNLSMPLIRYQIKDMAIEATQSSCACNRNSLKFADITGRIINHFKTKEGGLVHGQYFIHQFYFAEWISKFQIIQKEYDLIECEIVLRGKADNDKMKIIESNIRLVMGEDCRIKWVFVKDIEPTESGKYLYTISEIK